MTDHTADTNSNAKLAKIVFTPSGKRGEFPIGTSVLNAARSLGVDLDSVCGTRGICGRCQIMFSPGEFSKHGISAATDHLSAVNAVEDRYQRVKGELKPNRRLGCQAKIEGDAVIDIPEDSQVHRQVVRKAADHINVTLNPSIRLHYVEVREPDMHDPAGDVRRLKQSLADEWELTNLNFENNLLPAFQKILRKSSWKVTVAVHNGKHIVAVWPGFHDQALGVAIDVGSTHHRGSPFQFDQW